MPVDHTTSLGDLVRDRPETAALFERLGLDYCCGGWRTLGDACVQRQLDPSTVAAVIDTLPADDADDRFEVHDLSRASITELCDHIVVRHHGPLHPSLDRISHLLATVERVHGKDHPQLIDLRRLFETTRTELEEHMSLEERALFPACRAIDGGDAASHEDFDAGLLTLLEHEHATTGATLCGLRELSGGYEPGAALCSTHRATLTALRGFERDLHQHVHEENNILFPRVRARLARA